MDNTKRTHESDTLQERPQASALTWLFWWLITSPIGLPCWLLGVLIGVDRVQHAWFSLTYVIVRTIHGHRELADAPEASKPQDFVQEALDENNLLNIVRCCDGYYQRFVRNIDEMGLACRVELSVIIPGELKALGLEDSIDEALRYTLRQVRQGLFKTQLSLKPSVPSPEGAAAVEASAQAFPSQAAQATQQHGVADTAGTMAAARTRSTSGIEGKPTKGNRTLKQAQGKVIFAGDRRFTPEGGRPYSTFVVTVQTGDGEEVEFSGVDLQEKFGGEESAFRVGERVRIVQQGKCRVDVNEGGNSVPRYRNVFAVSHL